MHILITGGAGFIGSNLAENLTSRGHRVSIIDDYSTGARKNVSSLDVTLYEGSILDSPTLEAATASVDKIVHLAARPSVARSIDDPLATHEANATGTLRVLESARRHGIDHVIVASSSSVYGANTQLPKTEDLRLMPMSPYAVSKMATESYAISHATCFGMGVTAFRFFNVYGKYQAADHSYAAVIPAFIHAAMNDMPLIIHGDGLQTRDFTHVDSVVEVLALSVENRLVSVDPVNLAFGSRSSVLDVVAELEGIFGHALKTEHIAARIGDVRDSQADNTRLMKMIPNLRGFDLRKGLVSTVEWFKDSQG